MISKPQASLSLDLDNKWSYLKTHGDENWNRFPSYLDVVIPHFLKILQQYQLRITVFVVGQDAAIDANLPSLKMISAAGHEFGNHSFHHEPWLQNYSAKELEAEFDAAEQALRRISDQPLIGFRGPGYSLSADVLNLLSRRGYRYDCSTLPTYIGPLARAYYFMRSNLSAQESDDRKQLFGSLRDGLRPLKPYRWNTASGKLLEIPVTTMPIFKAPFHFSYLLFLAQKSAFLARLYFQWSMMLCRVTRTQPSMLLHPLDFLGNDDVDELDFFPAMAMPGQVKRDFIDSMLKLFVGSFEVLPMGEHAQRLLERAEKLPTRAMKF